MADLLLGVFGYGAKEVFNYNRENFKFDQDQQIQRESFRLRMQVLRFKLFREDVRDLVDLTVSRMDIYHLVGALFLQACVILMTEGRVQASAPPFLLSLFLLSTGSAFVYLLLAVWLSMHASIASHSFGVRLLTRFVRLPIPSLRQIEGLRFNLKDFEQQGATELMRVPFAQKQEWTQVNAYSGDVQKAAAAAAQPAAALRPPPVAKPASSSSSAAPSSRGRAGRKTSKAVAAPKNAHWSESMAVTEIDDVELLPKETDAADFPMGGEDLLASKSGAKPERHIELFRHLQSKWQCYDAYCRVCMSMGVNQILQGMSYYCICHTQVENHSPTTGYALVAIFQCTTIGLAILDLSGLTEIEILLVQIVGIMPCFLTAWGIHNKQHHSGGVLDPEMNYPTSPLSFLCQVLWLEMWYRISSPSDDEAKLPRRFRQTLFLDVFGDAKGWDPTNPDDPDTMFGLFDQNAAEETASEELFVVATKAAYHFKLAQCAVRRWRAAPDRGLRCEQSSQLTKLLERLNTLGTTIQHELDRSPVLKSIRIESELRPWRNLSPQQQGADPFQRCLIGPFEHDGGNNKMVLYHYDVENERMLFEDDPSGGAGSQNLVLSLDAVASVVADLEKEARALLETRIMSDLRTTTRQRAMAALTGEDEPPPSSSGGGGGGGGGGGRLGGSLDGLARLPSRCLSAARTAPGSGGNDTQRGTAVLSNFVDLFRRPTSSGYTPHQDDEEDEEEDDAQVAAPAVVPAAAATTAATKRPPRLAGAQAAAPGGGGSAAGARARSTSRGAAK